MNRLERRAILHDALALIFAIPFGGFVGGIVVGITLFILSLKMWGMPSNNMFFEHISLFFWTLLLSSAGAATTLVALPLFVWLARILDVRNAKKIHYVLTGLGSATIALIMLGSYLLFFERAFDFEFFIYFTLWALPSVLVAGAVGALLFFELRRKEKI